MIRPATLDCQACGITVRTLDASEAALVAEQPYNFIVTCPACSWSAERAASGHAYRTETDAPYAYCITCGCARSLHSL